MSHFLRAVVAPFPIDPADHPGYLTGQIYLLPPTVGPAAAVSAVDLVYLWMWMPDAAVTPATVGIRVVAAGTGSSVKIGVWANNPATMRPTGTPLVSNNTGAATTSANTAVLLSVAARYFVPGVPVWIGAKHTGTLPTVATVASNGDGARMWGGTVGGGIASHAVGLSAPDAYANDIGELDLTSATFTMVNATTSVPAFIIGT